MVARRLYRLAVRLLDTQDAQHDDIEAWDPELSEYLAPADMTEGGAKWLS